MLTYNNNSDTLIIVLHEIYGVNKHVINVCETLSKHHYDSIAPNLLKENVVFDYDQADLAYHNFMDNVGFENAMKQITQILCNVRPHYKRIYVLGYSIGAALAWLCSQTNLCDLVIGFYGSRIRDNLAVIPSCPTLLFFPTEEESFNVDELIVKLSCLDNVKVEKMQGKHCFADKFSKNYNRESSLKAIREVLLFAKQQFKKF